MALQALAHAAEVDMLVARTREQRAFGISADIALCLSQGGGMQTQPREAVFAEDARWNPGSSPGPDTEVQS